MRDFKTVKRQEVIKLTCDGCGLQASADGDYEFQEFISVKRTCGYGSIHGDGKQIDIDLCQQCFADMCGDTLTIIDPLDNQDSNSYEDTLEYQNIFEAITKSKHEANELKQGSDNKIFAREILSANRISTQKELQAALKRVEQLWDAQYHSAEGNELHKLADLICAYENKSWDSYFAQIPLADDNFMSERLNSIEGLPLEESGVASGILADTPVNKNIDEDDSRQSAIDEENTD
ncbi:hypothetical protein FGD67_19040 [Colwellia sp. M166]|uniref:hypothetical protein n=1 Tax=Colwellia sp. M166 TaxID=2583805 RepID=UPI00211DB408|nr:hypothetical protein [Colwellia sp. M166]UUO25072.1 hypothetical protein FGD67_19040 [Colwellia sp. M166]|tara:strand:+ start:1269 stop:1970 length:702 start_codon:yes stop_codon:yes gene_type:complete